MPPFGNLYGMMVFVAQNLREDEAIVTIRVHANLGAKPRAAEPHGAAGAQRPAQLPEALGMYLDDKLRRHYAAITEVWLLGQGTAETGDVVWELLVFADRETLAAIRADVALPRTDLRLVVVVDGDRFESVWGDPRPGRLSECRWRQEGSHAARYALPLGADSDRGTNGHRVATRVR